MGWLFGWLKSIFTPQAAPNELVIKVQAATVKLCGFLPMAETVASLVALSNPAVAGPVTTASVIAHKICGAVKAPRVMWHGTMNVPTEEWIVDGVPIEGEFINKE